MTELRDRIIELAERALAVVDETGHDLRPEDRSMIAELKAMARPARQAELSPESAQRAIGRPGAAS